MIDLNDLHKKYPWKTISNFGPIAKKHGFSEQEVKEFLKKDIVHDKLKLNTSARNYYLPIYGRQRGVYQFDTLIQSNQKKSRGNIYYPREFLIIININSRKGYAYPLRTKSSLEVYKALCDFYKECSDKPTQMTSDQDPAYLSHSVIDFMKENHIDYRTTEDNNHNILGIINRFILTLRNLNQERDFTKKSMSRLIDLYNNTEHSSTGIKPNDFTAEDEIKYIDKMNELTNTIKERDGFRLKPGTKVRIINDTSTIGKKRSNLSKDYYQIVSADGNAYLIKARDESVASYPRYRLVPSSKGSFAETLNHAKRGIVSEIISYNEDTNKYNNKYTIRYTDD